MEKIAVTQVLKNYRGDDLTEKRGEPGEEVEKPLTFRDVVSTALNATGSKEKPLTAEDKSKCFQLSIRLWLGKNWDISLDERKFVKDRVAIFFSPLVLGRVTQILEGEGKKKGKEKEEEEKTD